MTEPTDPQVRPVFANKIPGLTTIELPEKTWITIGLDGWSYNDGGVEHDISYAEVYFSPKAESHTDRGWVAVLSIERGRGYDQFADARGETLVDALKAAAAEAGDGLTIREEWK